MVGVVLGGSRAIGAHRPDSDVDLGLHYRGGLAVAALRALAGEVADQVLGISEIGGWGPWVNGGAWLVVDGTRVDWIYRDTDRVAAIWAECRAGRYELGVQAGHPLGYYSHVYPGEVALCHVLADSDRRADPAARRDPALPRCAGRRPGRRHLGARAPALRRLQPRRPGGGRVLRRRLPVPRDRRARPRAARPPPPLGDHREAADRRRRPAARRPAGLRAARPRHPRPARHGDSEIAPAVAAARELVADTVARLPPRPGERLPL